MKTYIGAKIIAAEPEKHKDGREGYCVVYPDGYTSWSPKDTFETAYREITFHERQLLEQTDAEHQVSRISSGPQTPEDTAEPILLVTIVGGCTRSAYTKNNLAQVEQAKLAAVLTGQKCRCFELEIGPGGTPHIIAELDTDQP